MVECDTGRKRAGVETPAEAIALAREIAASKGLSFAGFMLYPTETGWAEAQRFYDEALAGVRAHGLDAAMVSTGGTPNLKNVGKLKGATEHRPGTYIYNDRMQVAAGVASWDDCALNIYSTVVSRAGPDRGILDAGSKTLTSDTGGGLDGHGLILEHPEARIARFAEEHGFLDLTRSNTRPNVGDVVRIVPNHVCVVVNMMDEVVMVRGDEIIGTLPVAARGKLRYGDYRHANSEEIRRDALFALARFVSSATSTRLSPPPRRWRTRPAADSRRSALPSRAFRRRRTRRASGGS